MNLSERYKNKKHKIVIARGDGTIIEKEIDINNNTGLFVIKVPENTPDEHLTSINNTMQLMLEGLNDSNKNSVVVIPDNMSIEYIRM